MKTFLQLYNEARRWHEAEMDPSNQANTSATNTQQPDPSQPDDDQSDNDSQQDDPVAQLQQCYDLLGKAIKSLGNGQQQQQPPLGNQQPQVQQ